MSSKTFVRGRKIHDMERAHFRLTITYPLSKTVHFLKKIVFTWLESIYICTHPSAILCYLISIWVGIESQHLFWSSCNQIKEIANLANSILFDIAVQHDSMITQNTQINASENKKYNLSEIFQQSIRKSNSFNKHCNEATFIQKQIRCNALWMNSFFLMLF